MKISKWKKKKIKITIKCNLRWNVILYSRIFKFILTHWIFEKRISREKFWSLKSLIRSLSRESKKRRMPNDSLKFICRKKKKKKFVSEFTAFRSCFCAIPIFLFFFFFSFRAFGLSPSLPPPFLPPSPLNVNSFTRASQQNNCQKYNKSKLLHVLKKLHINFEIIPP